MRGKTNPKEMLLSIISSDKIPQLQNKSPNPGGKQAGGPRVQNHPWLYSNFKANLGYMRLSPNNNSKRLFLGGRAN